MTYVCVTLGFCGSCPGPGQGRYVHHRYPDEGEVTADQFLEWVLWADRCDPDRTSEDLKRQIHGAFVGIMGAEVVDVRRLGGDLDV